MGNRADQKPGEDPCAKASSAAPVALADSRSVRITGRALPPTRNLDRRRVARRSSSIRGWFAVDGPALDLEHRGAPVGCDGPCRCSVGHGIQRCEACSRLVWDWLAG